MLQIVGIIVVFVMVFGGFLAAGGHLDVVIEAAPFELIIILGSGLGAFLLRKPTRRLS